MFEYLQQFSFWTEVAIASAVIAAIASVGERRRNNRKDLDRVGFMPWTLIQVLAILSAVFSASLAIKGM